MMKIAKPAARRKAGPTRVTLSPTESSLESFPVAWIARRFRVSPHLARLIAEVAGLGARP